MVFSVNAKEGTDKSFAAFQSNAKQFKDTRQTNAKNAAATTVGTSGWFLTTILGLVVSLQMMA
jgi:hypothetical protein